MLFRFVRRVAGAFTYPSATGTRPHAPTKLGTPNIFYDANGNMTGDGTRVLAWDGANRLKTVTIGSAVTNLLPPARGISSRARNRRLTPRTTSRSTISGPSRGPPPRPAAL